MLSIHAGAYAVIWKEGRYFAMIKCTFHLCTDNWRLNLLNGRNLKKMYSLNHARNLRLKYTLKINRWVSGARKLFIIKNEIPFFWKVFFNLSKVKTCNWPLTKSVLSELFPPALSSLSNLVLYTRGLQIRPRLSWYVDGMNKIVGRIYKIRGIIFYTTQELSYPKSRFRWLLTPNIFL